MSLAEQEADIQQEPHEQPEAPAGLSDASKQVVAVWALRPCSQTA